MRKLTIVVTCTDRKSVPAAERLQVRSLPNGTVSQRSDEWRRRVSGAAHELVLQDLYQGEAWIEVGKLAHEARVRGYRPRVLVVSAGLGLRAVTDQAPSYAATFTTRQLDSVSSSSTDASSWWRRLVDLPGALDPKAELRGRTLLVLSGPYARAMDEDLQVLAERSQDVLLIGGARSVEGLPRVPADLGLRHRLGGTATSLNLRMARAWLARSSGTALHDPEIRRSWDRWARGARRLEQYDRRAVTDQQALALIDSIRKNEPGISASRALRSVRDAGVACEQKRFHSLFRTASGSAQ